MMSNDGMMTKELDSVGENPLIYLERPEENRKNLFLDVQPLCRDMNLGLPYNNKVFYPLKGDLR